MSANPQTSEPQAETERDEHGHHPGPRDYVRIAVILGVLTLLEYSTYVFDFGGLGIPLLVVLIVLKFVIVASWFMHLKFDTKLYGRFLYGGLAFAVGLYGITLLVFAFDHAPSL